MMNKFEAPTAELFDLGSDEIMAALSGDLVEYDTNPTQGATEFPDDDSFVSPSGN